MLFAHANVRAKQEAEAIGRKSAATLVPRFRLLTRTRKSCFVHINTAETHMAAACLTAKSASPELTI